MQIPSVQKISTNHSPLVPCSLVARRRRPLALVLLASSHFKMRKPPCVGVWIIKPKLKDFRLQYVVMGRSSYHAKTTTMPNSLACDSHHSSSLCPNWFS